MPLSIALRTSSQPPVCAAALPVATRMSATASTFLRGSATAASSCHDLVAEERGEGAARPEQLRGRAGFDDEAVAEHDSAVGEPDGREALGRDEHRLAFERRPQALDEA